MEGLLSRSDVSVIDHLYLKVGIEVIGVLFRVFFGKILKLDFFFQYKHGNIIKTESNLCRFFSHL